MTRTAKKTKVSVTLEQAHVAAKNYATASTKLDSIQAKMNEEIIKVKDKYLAKINELNEAIIEPVETLESFAIANKDSWDKKSLELPHCVIGFRTGTPKVEKEKKFTWDAITKMLSNNKIFKDFVRTKSEVDKGAILKIDDAKLLKKLNEYCGLEIVQEESFYVDCKKEELAA